jgi:NADH:ubiquinone oxidoreductase subunit F (NADH-binding)
MAVDVLRLTEVLAGLPTERTRLLDNLGRLRREVGPITAELSDALADHMNLRRGDVHEVKAFYSFLEVPADAHRVCTGVVCDAAGRGPTPPGAIEVPCLGHCELAPVSTRGDEILGPVVHRTNRGVLGLHERDGTLADHERRGGLALLRDLPPPGEVIRRLRDAGLTGYGGAGFPAAAKWEAVASEPAPRVVVVNADEGEPGTIKDRYVLELRPHLLVEATLIAMATVGAEAGYVYLREEYATARARLHDAIVEFRAAGLLDGRTLELVVGAGAYVCGEETAMLESMEGRRGMPRLKPPYPSASGYLGRPTLVNNVETLAHVPAILEGRWTPCRLWSVTGAVREPGCYEAPLDVTARQLVDEYAGGATEELGALVPGGAASGILPPAALDVPLTAAALADWGAGPGSGALQVFGRSYPVRRLLAETMRFFAEEACGKCTPCRIGNRAMHHLVDGRVTMPRHRVEQWLETMARTSVCGLGQTAPVPMRTAMRHFPEELPQW